MDNNIVGVLSSALLATLDAENNGYKQYVEILRQLEGMRPIEFTYYDSDNKQRSLKVPPITLVPLTMLHIKRASFDFSLSVSSFDTMAADGLPSLQHQPTGDVGVIDEEGMPVCYNPTTYTLHEQGGGQVMTAETIRLGQTTGTRRASSRLASVRFSLIRTYDYFAIIDDKYYVPKVVDSNSLPDTYVTSKYLLNNLIIGLSANQRLVYVLAENQDLSAISSNVRHTFYKDGRYSDSTGTMFTPSSNGQLINFLYKKTEGSVTIQCSFTGTYLSAAQAELNKNRLQVKSENKKDGNLNITVKMGQASISSGIINLLNAKKNSK